MLHYSKILGRYLKCMSLQLFNQQVQVMSLTTYTRRQLTAPGATRQTAKNYSVYQYGKASPKIAMTNGHQPPPSTVLPPVTFMLSQFLRVTYVDLWWILHILVYHIIFLKSFSRGNCIQKSQSDVLYSSSPMRNNRCYLDACLMIVGFQVFQNYLAA